MQGKCLVKVNQVNLLRSLLIWISSTLKLSFKLQGKKETTGLFSTFSFGFITKLFKHYCEKVPSISFKLKEDTVVFGFFSNLIPTVVIAFVTNYAIILIFQNIMSHIKLFLLIAAL